MREFLKGESGSSNEYIGFPLMIIVCMVILSDLTLFPSFIEGGWGAVGETVWDLPLGVRVLLTPIFALVLMAIMGLLVTCLLLLLVSALWVWEKIKGQPSAD